MAIKEALQGARDEAQRLQARVRVPTICVGIVLIAVGYVARARKTGSYITPTNSLLCHASVSFGTLCLILAVLPSDRRAPRVVTVIKVGMWCTLLPWYFYDLWRAGAFSGLYRPAFYNLCRICWGSEPGSDTCDLRIVRVALSMLLIAIHIITFYLIVGVCKPPHVVLDRLWRSTRWTSIAFLLAYTVPLPTVVYMGFRGRVPADEVLVQIIRVLFDVVIAILASWTKFRRRLQFTLQAQGGEVTAAGAIAAFIGGRDASEVIAEARRSCRYVSLEDVTEADLRACTPDAALSRLSRPCKLSDVDAFLSHSWHDAPEAKWEVLQAWRAVFRAANGREARVWIDKYCIDQTDIQASLMCLPVFLAGCQILLILAGPTYLSRLWCIEEVFIYLQMGRGPETMEMRLLSEDVVDHIERFSVRDARCHLAEDEATLLATIEAGFCNFDAFDSQVRSALRAALLGCAGA